MLTVACVLSPGPGGYEPWHVHRLRDQVAPHIEQPYRFVCLTNNDAVEVERVPLVHDWPGWWAKIELFRPTLFRRGERVLYLDLDLEVVGGLDIIGNMHTPFAIIEDWLRLGWNSSVMTWDTGIRAVEAIYTAFEARTSAIMDRCRGDQDWIFEQTPWATKIPRRWVGSYKYAKHTGVVPSDPRVWVYHGQPKPWDLESPAETGDSAR